MKVGIRQIALEAGVSTATVSHALNKTRYVSPELAERIFAAAKRLGYDGQSRGAGADALRVGKLSEIAFVVPGLFSIVYANLVNELSQNCLRAGYTLSVYNSGGDAQVEKHIVAELLADRRVAGLILCPCQPGSAHYKKLLAAEKPFVCIDREIEGGAADCVLSNNLQGIRDGMQHLIRDGHERIALLLEDKDLTTTKQRRDGYISALKEHGIEVDEALILSVPLADGKQSRKSIKHFIRAAMPTAILAAGNTLTLRCLKSIEEMGLSCPKNISVVGFGDNEWCGLITPSLTSLTQNTRELARNTLELLLARVAAAPAKPPVQKILVPMDFTIRESTLSIARGPFGERVAYPEDITLDPEDIEKLKQGGYSVAIAFHYTGNEWTRLHELAIKETLSGWGVRVMAITDANFDPELQNTQLESLIMQHPDALIAIPVDETSTAAKFKEVSQKTKLVLINNVPKGLSQSDFGYWISVNEKENGQAAAKVLQDYFHEQGRQARVGMLIHGTPFFCTKQRDFFAERTFLEGSSELCVVAKKSFYTIDNTYEACRQMVQEHPEINGMYITWERPALQAIRALKELGREDIAITTTDLDYEIASYLARREMVVGLSSQRPYEQGVAVATATARTLLGKRGGVNCIGVPPYTVKADNLEKAWKDILRTEWRQP